MFWYILHTICHTLYSFPGTERGILEAFYLLHLYYLLSPTDPVHTKIYLDFKQSSLSLISIHLSLVHICIFLLLQHFYNHISTKHTNSPSKSLHPHSKFHSLQAAGTGTMGIAKCSSFPLKQSNVSGY